MLREQPAKFTFAKEFNDKSGHSMQGLEREIAALRALIPQAEARGFDAGKHDANTQLHQTLERLTSSALALFNVLDKERESLKAEAVELSLLVARILAGHVLDREPAQAIRDLVSASMDSLRKSPHIVLRVHPGIVESVEAHLKTLCFERGLDGRLIVLGDPENTMGDCKIEWADGGFERKREDAERQISEAVTRYFNENSNTNPVKTEETNV